MIQRYTEDKQNSKCRNSNRRTFESIAKDCISTNSKNDQYTLTGGGETKYLNSKKTIYEKYKSKCISNNNL